MDITVAIAAYRPRLDYLARVMEGLRQQTFPIDRWELLLIDNNSPEPYEAQVRPDWHPRYRFLNEPKQGLAHVRRRSFEEAAGSLVILVDDDLILYPDYLEQAWKLYHELPFIGIMGTQLFPEFEQPPTLRVDLYLNAERKIPKSAWSNLLEDHPSTPWGAGMCVRSEVAKAYLQVLYKEPWRMELGRKGSKRLSCEDMDIAIFVCQNGWGKGLFTELRATHLVPIAKMQPKHLIDTYYWNVYSYSVQNYLTFGVKPALQSGLKNKIRTYWRERNKSAIERAFTKSKRKAEQDLLKDIQSGENFKIA